MFRPTPLPPGPGQESVWDYPRPPALESTDERVIVRLGEQVIADTTGAFRVLETSHPPSYYLPPDDISEAALVTVAGPASFCEWKGVAAYADVVGDGQRVAQACWWYDTPTPGFAAIAGFRSFYPHLVHCTVNGEEVRPQAGGFYGGWITDRVVGPFKGEPGTRGW